MKQRMIVMLVLVAGLVGCEPPKPPIPLHGISQSGITVDQYLSFKTTYTMPLTDGRTLKVDSLSEPWLSDTIDFSDQLQQADGRWVIFDCDNIADKIIDHSLVTEVTPYCANIHETAKLFWEERNYTPDEFMDRQGVVWKKVQ